MPLEKINDEQMEILLDFADRCRHLCFGRQSCRSDAQSIAYREWKELSRDMNYAGPDNKWKSGLEWKCYWTALKNKAKAKMAHAKRRSQSKGDQLRVNLTPYESRIIELAELAASEAQMKKDTSDESTDGSDESQVEEHENIRPESVVIKVAPAHIEEVPSNHNLQSSEQIHNYQSAYNCNMHNSLVQPEMISIIQAEINGMSQAHSSNCEPINMSQYNNIDRCVSKRNSHDISDSILSTSQSYTEISSQDMSQTLPVRRNYAQMNGAQSINTAQMGVNTAQMSVNTAQMSLKTAQMSESHSINKAQRLNTAQRKNVATQCSVPMNMNMRDFATSPVNVNNNCGQEQLSVGQAISEPRFEAIRCLAQAISNLAEGTQAVARAQRMLATSHKAMANSQELLASTLQNCGDWQNSLAASNEAIASALRGLRENI